MNVDDGPTGIKITHERVERGVSEEFVAITRKETDSLEVQILKTIPRFGNRGIHVVHRHETEASEAQWMIGDQLSGVIVAPAREAGSLLDRKKGCARPRR